MRFGSGTYDVRQSEGINPLLLRSSVHRSLTCTVFFLDGSERVFHIDRNSTGQELIDKVFSHVELVERDFFGLQFICIVDTRDTQQKRWLQPEKSVRKQMICPPYNLFFRVKFYVSDPSKLTEEYTRYHFFLQLRKDLLDGKLQCAEGSLALLGSYAAQSELGDYNSDEMSPGYLDNFVVAPHQPVDLGRRMEELHKVHQGQSPAEAEFNFLDHAKRLEMYGVELYTATDGNSFPISLGVNSFGMLVFHEGKKINEFPWANILKISFKRKQFYVTVRMNEEKGDDLQTTCLIFNMSTSPSCKQLWKTCIEHHSFFRLIAPPVPPPRGLFHIGSRYRYSGRTEYQTMEEMKHRARVERTFARPGSRSTSSRATISGVPSSVSTPSHTASPDLGSRIFGRSSSWAKRFLPGKRSASLHGPTCPPRPASPAQSQNSQPWAGTPTPGTQRITAPLTDLVRKKRIDVLERQWSMRGSRHPPPSPSLTISAHASLGERLGDESETYDLLGEQFSRSLSIQSEDESESSAPSLRRARETTFGVREETDEQEASWTPSMIGTQASTSANIHHRPSAHTTNGSVLRSSKQGLPNGYANGYVSTAPNGCASGTVSSHNSSTNGFAPGTGVSVNRFPLNGSLRSSPRMSATTLGATPNNHQSPRNSANSYFSYVSGGSSPPRTRRSPQSHKSNSPVGEDSVVNVRMRPDAQGRFGFNVKGGADQNYPVIVSRVAPGSSADRCHPRLNEGDQVLMINGRDVSQMSHDQVVAFIRSARQQPHGGELVLTIRANVYRLGEDVPEPDVFLVPEAVRVSDTVPRSDKLSHSMRILQESLQAGAIVNQFDQLYRKKPGLSMNDCRLASNVNKNRYRDVCPYDSTRVVLQSSPNGDYINASFVNMEIPSSGIVNRYIACQGPLVHTTPDFWIMCWEQLCTTIVMLTTTVERGRTKCHQYWPRLHETTEYGRLSVTCIKERDTANCSYRELSVRDRQSKEERRITQMQYSAWPDHGVPDDPKQFIQFVDEVRRARAGSVEPIIVHCSAGIGRTGVLILMETASCLVEANEPVYPLDIVRTMRDQRAMLIQTPGQYTFVCESIVCAYNDGVIKPLAEYQKR